MAQSVIEVLAEIDQQVLPLTRESFHYLLTECSPASAAPIAALLEKYGSVYCAEADRFCQRMRQRYSNKTDYLQSLERFGELVFAYLRWTAVYLMEGEYAAILNPEAHFQRKDLEDFYLDGLMWSYLFWVNHYQIRDFFRNWVLASKAESYLEVGLGHGLFFADALEQGSFSDLIGCDISPKAIAFARETLAKLGHSASSYRLVEADFLSTDFEKQVDVCVLVEVLEHVWEPRQFLKRARSILSSGGRVFLTTVVHVPFVDHVYHFRSVAEIRNMLAECGLEIVRENVTPTFGMPEKQVAFDYMALCKSNAR